MLLRKFDYIEEDIIKTLESKQKVFIESGAANDEIVNYKTLFDYQYNPCGEDYKIKKIIFETTACIFPKEISFEEFYNVEFEWFDNNLFIKI